MVCAGVLILSLSVHGVGKSFSSSAYLLVFYLSIHPALFCSGGIMVTPIHDDFREDDTGLWVRDWVKMIVLVFAQRITHGLVRIIRW